MNQKVPYILAYKLRFFGHFLIKNNLKRGGSVELSSKDCVFFLYYLNCSLWGHRSYSHISRPANSQPFQFAAQLRSKVLNLHVSLAILTGFMITNIWLKHSGILNWMDGPDLMELSLLDLEISLELRLNSHDITREYPQYKSE